MDTFEVGMDKLSVYVPPGTGEAAGDRRSNLHLGRTYDGLRRTRRVNELQHQKGLK